MKKLFLIILLLAVFSAYAQTDNKETLERLNQNVISSYQNQHFRQLY